MEDLSKFIINCNGVEVYSAYAVVPPALLDVEIPTTMLDLCYGEGVVTSLTLRDFSMAINNEANTENKTVSLMARTKGYNRVSPGSLQDLTLWVQYVAAYGVTVADLLTQEEYMGIVEYDVPPWTPEEVEN